MWRFSFPSTFILFLGLLFAGTAARAQGVLTVSTDQTAYAYGEPIEITITVNNPTTEPFTLTGSSNCQAFFRFDAFDAVDHMICLTDFIEITFQPGSERSWRFTVDPALHGLPRSDEPHTIVGYYPGTEVADSTVITAPKYLGGILNVGVEVGASESEVAAIRASLNANVLDRVAYSWGTDERWQISGTTLEEAEARYATDPKFRYVLPVRSIGLGAIISDTESPEPFPSAPSASVYPNPCHQTCMLALTLPSPDRGRITVIDATGRTVLITSDRPFGIGESHVPLDLRTLPPGAYIYRVEGARVRLSGVFIVTE